MYKLAAVQQNWLRFFKNFKKQFKTVRALRVKVVIKMLVVAVNLAKVFLKVIILLIKKCQQAPVILITQAKIM